MLTVDGHWRVEVTLELVGSSRKNSLAGLDATVDVLSGDEAASLCLEHEGSVGAFEFICLSGLELDLLDLHSGLARDLDIGPADVASGLDGANIELLVSHRLEELLLDVVELGLELFFLLLGDLLEVLLVLDNLGFVGLLLHHFEVLLSAELSLEDLLHNFLLLGGRLVEGLAQLHDGDGTFGVTDGRQVLVHRDRRQRRVTDLLAVGHFVLSVVEVPHIEETVDAGQEEQTASGGGPAAVSQVARVVTSLHDGRLQLLTPDLGLPVTDREEVLHVAGVPLQRVDRAVMLAALDTESLGNFDRLSLVGL
mmetsp:Transcript_33233/g.50950  ORF Transcript_33233/g.50950 Transcript_33233/m.50950 type:complete len:309 (+) Transcript_33233:73-999(+)